MKYGAIPTNLFERLALWSGRVPVPIIDVLFEERRRRTIRADSFYVLTFYVRPLPFYSLSFSLATFSFGLALVARLRGVLAGAGSLVA
jgi:hypothetical protein